MKDYDQYLINVNYNSGVRVAFWVYQFSFTESRTGNQITWESSCTEPRDVREYLAKCGIVCASHPVNIAIDLDTIESVYVLEKHIGKDGEKGSD